MMFFVKSAVGGLIRGHQQAPLQSFLKVLTAGMKTLERPLDFRNVVLPEKTKLKLLNKGPKIQRPIKEPRKLRDIQGPAKAANSFRIGQFAIVAMGGGYLHWGHLEMMRLTINRKLDHRRMFARWRISPPYKPITRRSLGHRMGGGKGDVEFYVTPVRCGRLILELGGKMELGEVEPLLIQVAGKLPFPAKVVSRESLAEMQRMHQEMEQNNQNPWTFKKIVQGNMMGLRRVLSPLELHNHGRYSGKFYFPWRV